MSAMFSKLLNMQKIQSERKAVPSANAMIGTLKAYKIDDSKTAIRSIYANKHFN